MNKRNKKETLKLYNGEVSKSNINASMVLLLLYIFLLYTAQKTLIPPQVHSIVLYTFVLWTGYTIIDNSGVFFVEKYTFWYLGLIILGFVSQILPKESDTNALYIMFVTLVLTWCIIWTVNTKERFLLCLKTYVIAADSMAVMLLFTGQLSNSNGERLGESITGNANSFSALIMMAAVFSAWFFVFEKKKSYKLYYLISLACQLYLMAASGGRKTLLAVIACYVWFLFTRDISDAVKTLRNLIFIVLTVCILLYAIMKIPALYESVGKRFEGLMSFSKGGESNVSSDEIRKTLIEIGLKGWTQRFIFGWGLDTFKYYNKVVTGHFYYAHNNYVELLYDLGIIGFMYYYGYFVWFVKMVFRISEVNKHVRALALGVVLELAVHDIGGISYFNIVNQVLLCIIFIGVRLYVIQDDTAALNYKSEY